MVIRYNVEPDKTPWVQVCYGTGQKTPSQHYQAGPNDLIISAECASSCGLATETRFDISSARPLPFNGTWFVVKTGFSCVRIGKIPNEQVGDMVAKAIRLFPTVASAFYVHKPKETIVYKKRLYKRPGLEDTLLDSGE
jgi:hypothetical protein